MDKIFISHLSALEFYRNARVNNKLNLLDDNLSRNSLILKSSSAKPLENSTIKFSDLKYIVLPYCGDKPFDLCVNNKKTEYRKKNLKLHHINQNIPRGSFLKYSDEVYISSPELLFCQLSNLFNIEELFLLGLEFCGKYCVNTSYENNFYYGVAPLTTKKKLLAFVNCIHINYRNYPGIHKAITVSNLIINNSASPQESRLIIKLCMKRSFGGYEVRGLKANQKIKLSKDAENILGYGYITPDLSNPKTNIAIEYDSNKYHDNMQQNEKDKLRANAFYCDGWKLFTFVTKQMRNVNSFHNLAIEILKANNQDPRIRGKYFEDKRRDLWTSL